MNERLKECESDERVRVRERESERVTFEHRHENKSCSACPECVNEIVQVLQVPSFCLTFFTGRPDSKKSIFFIKTKTNTNRKLNQII